MNTDSCMLQDAWDALQAVPSYVEQQARRFAEEPLLTLVNVQNNPVPGGTEDDRCSWQMQEMVR